MFQSQLPPPPERSLNTDGRSHSAVMHEEDTIACARKTQT